ncbi:hypothetical protein [Burkholderia ubonensis]|uniref:hypothetical protein n=1 Tax=Burkholderia ubonensis TaxID=101571 RepID=UPI000A92CB19|nr:hypothetical protein [Burkholderia ubonensis]
MAKADSSKTLRINESTYSKGQAFGESTEDNNRVEGVITDLSDRDVILSNLTVRAHGHEVAPVIDVKIGDDTIKANHQVAVIPTKLLEKKVRVDFVNPYGRGFVYMQYLK